MDSEKEFMDVDPGLVEAAAEDAANELLEGVGMLKAALAAYRAALEKLDSAYWNVVGFEKSFRPAGTWYVSDDMRRCMKRMLELKDDELGLAELPGAFEKLSFRMRCEGCTEADEARECKEAATDKERSRPETGAPAPRKPLPKPFRNIGDAMADQDCEKMLMDSMKSIRTALMKHYGLMDETDEDRMVWDDELGKYREGTPEELDEKHDSFWEGGVYDLKYRITDDLDLEYDSVSICVAWGGPTIWVDTGSGTVEGWWWLSFREIHISHELCKRLDRSFVADYTAWKHNHCRGGRPDGEFFERVEIVYRKETEMWDRWDSTSVLTRTTTRRSTPST